MSGWIQDVFRADRTYGWFACAAYGNKGVREDSSLCRLSEWARWGAVGEGQILRARSLGSKSLVLAMVSV